MTFWHKHKWKVTGAQQMYLFNNVRKEVRTPITEVLLVCDCREVKTITLDGHWTLDQLQPPQGTAREVDLEFLRRMGAKL